MYRIKAPALAAIIIGLLAGSAVGVTAQEEAVGPVEFTGATGFGGRGGGPYWVDTIVEPFTDPRLAGEFRVWENNRAYRAVPRSGGPASRSTMTMAAGSNAPGSRSATLTARARRG